MIGRICLALLLPLLALWSIHLWPLWLRSPDLTHGLFTPFLFALLLYESRSRYPRRYLAPRRWHFLVIAGFFGLAIGLLGVGGLYAAILSWSHTLTLFVLAVSLCALLTATWIILAQDRVRWLPFNWTIAVAILIWLLSAPIPPGTYTRLTLWLQQGVTEGVLATLHFLGIAALKNGNIIELARVSVGVEEACSGIRSLLSCLYAGLFFSATLVRRIPHRLLIIGLAPVLAIVMNFLRSLLLTLLAHGGQNIQGTIHDLTGFGILIVTSGILALLAWFLDRATPVASPAPASTHTTPPLLYLGKLPATLVASLAIYWAITIFFVFKTNTASTTPPAVAPSLSQLIPSEAPGWQVTTAEDLYRFTSQLQTEHLLQRNYTRQTPAGPEQITLYLAYWPAQSAPVSVVASHTPDACWPGAGWTAVPTEAPLVTLTTAGHNLPPAQHRQFKLNNYPQHVWFWHIHGGRPVLTGEIRSPLNLLRLAFSHGLHRDRAQLFIRVSSNLPWEKISSTPLITEFTDRLQAHGL